MFWTSMAVMLLAAAPCAAGGVLRKASVPGASVLPAPALAAPLLPRASVAAVAGAAPAPLPILSPAPASARAVAALAAPSPGAVGVAEASPAVVQGRSVAAAAAKQAAPLSDRKAGPAAAQARSAAFFDGTRSFPDLVENAGLEGIVRELREPARLLQAMGVKGTVTVYGSARIPEPEAAQAAFDKAVRRHGRRPTTRAGRAAVRDAREALRASRWYEEARRFGRLVAERGGGELAVVTGGGPGIMEAANRGAFEAGGKSVGYNIILEHEQSANPWVTPGLAFEFANFTTRKMNLRHGAVGLAYFPGGFGTMDELFEVLTLMQTGKMPRVPIVLVGERAYWNKVLRFGEFARQGLISRDDLKLFTFAEDAEQAWAAIENAAKR
ncbi:MAG: TIGR00730 family Rossman fold protein [Elusimicrobia bacterium]|nr:TIGR00730 family Rossman fold protein [Elusimicrobiota bacterium]